MTLVGAAGIPVRRYNLHAIPSKISRSHQRLATGIAHSSASSKLDKQYGGRQTSTPNFGRSPPAEEPGG